MEIKIYAFLTLLAFFVGIFVWHIRDLKCDDTNGFDVPCHKMYMSFGVLFCIGILLLTSGGLYILLPPPSDNASFPAKDVFDSFTKQLIPIATLVLGYYFGTASDKPEKPKKPNPQNTGDQAPPENSEGRP